MNTKNNAELLEMVQKWGELIGSRMGRQDCFVAVQSLRTGVTFDGGVLTVRFALLAHSCVPFCQVNLLSAAQRTQGPLAGRAEGCEAVAWLGGDAPGRPPALQHRCSFHRSRAASAARCSPEGRVGWEQVCLHSSPHTPQQDVLAARIWVQAVAWWGGQAGREGRG